MTRSKPRCTFTGCTRFARPGFDRCTSHRNAVDRQGKPPSKIEAQLATNNYGKYTALVLQTAADGGDGLDNEIAVLRATLARVMDTEADPSKLAAAVARLSQSIIQAMRTKRTLSGTAADEFTDAVALILEELQQ